MPNLVLTLLSEITATETPTSVAATRLRTLQCTQTPQPQVSTTEEAARSHLGFADNKQ